MKSNKYNGKVKPGTRVVRAKVGGWWISLLLVLCLTTLLESQNVHKDAKVYFRKVVLDHDFVSEGVAIGDINRDGKLDIMAGAYWFEAPIWKKHKIDKTAKVFSVTNYSDSFLDYAMDVNQDGWLDEIRIGFPGEAAYWYENPGNEEGAWEKHLIYSSIGDESPGFVDINHDGRKDLVFADAKNKRWVWLQPPEPKDTSWTPHVFSTNQSARRFTHGLGFGNVHQNGRPDVLIKRGWWEVQPHPKQEPNWKFHHADFGDDCAQMYTMDVDKDGDQDVISSSAHHYGIWWHEQVKHPSGKVMWKMHVIYKGFSQSHALAMADMNGDGYPDLITGKRFFAHNGKGHDPGDHQPAVLYWFEYRANKKKPRWMPHKIDNNSGVGLQVLAQDITGDNLRDIIVSNKKGVFLFKQLQN